MSASIWNPGTPAGNTAASISYQLDAANSVSRNVAAKLEEIVSVKDFGAVGDGVTDDTQAILDALNTFYGVFGSGVLYFPRGVYRVTSLSFNCTNFSIELRGEGLDCTVIRKLGTDATPVIHLFSGNTDRQVIIANMEIDGNNVANCDPLYLETLNQVNLKNLRVWKGRYAVNCYGTLISKFEFVEGRNSLKGFLFRAYMPSTLYCNHVTLDNCRGLGNIEWAVDYGEGTGLYVNECDFEGNGTAGNVNTGGVIIRDTIDNEVGYGQAIISNSWFEQNKGRNISVEGGSGANVEVHFTQFFATESGRVIYTAPGLRRFAMYGVIAAAPGDTVEINSENYSEGNCFVSIITDNSVNKNILGQKTATIDSRVQIKSSGANNLIDIGTSPVVASNTPKALCSFNGSLASPITPAFVYNVSTITKSATGNYQVNFPAAFTAGPVVITALDNTGEALPVRFISKSTTTYRFLVTNLAGVPVDAEEVSVAAWGT